MELTLCPECSGEVTGQESRCRCCGHDFLSLEAEKINHQIGWDNGSEALGNRASEFGSDCRLSPELLAELDENIEEIITREPHPSCLPIVFITAVFVMGGLILAAF